MISRYVAVVKIYTVVCKTNHDIAEPAAFYRTQNVNTKCKCVVAALGEIYGYVLIGKIRNCLRVSVIIRRKRYDFV